MKIVKTYNRLLALADRKKCVYNTRVKAKRHIPAARVVHYPAYLVHQMLKNSVLAEYVPKK